MRKFDLAERLPISLIKQYLYCKRRFALMSIDNEWGCNYKIIEGDILHSKVNDPTIVEKRGDRIISRSVPVYSSTLGVCGVADVVEFIRVEDGVTLPGRKGHFKPNPVEYKNGSPQSSDYAQPSHSSRGAWIET